MLDGQLGALHVDREGLVEVVFVGFVQRRGVGDAGVDEHGVDLAERVGCGLEQPGQGRAATLAAGTISLTIAIGPLCGGLISTWVSYSAIGWFSLALCLLSAGAFRMTDSFASNRPVISQ